MKLALRVAKNNSLLLLWSQQEKLIWKGTEGDVGIFAETELGSRSQI